MHRWTGSLILEVQQYLASPFEMFHRRKGVQIINIEEYRNTFFGTPWIAIFGFWKNKLRANKFDMIYEIFAFYKLSL